MNEVSLMDVLLAVNKLDLRLTALEAKLTDAASVKQDHEARLRGLERWAYAVPASLLAAVVASVVSVVK